MKFKIEKKGYSEEEVDEYIEKLTASYEEALSLQKQRIFDLKKSLTEAENSIKAYKEKSNLVTKAIYNAVAKAEEIERLSQIKYNQEIEQLKAFHDKWVSHYNKILEKYPLDNDLMAASKFNNQMRSILSKTNKDEVKKVADEISGTIEKGLENNYLAETERLNEKQIGYIKIVTSDDSDKKDDELMQEILPDGNLDSPILSGNFDPLERINRYFNSEKNKVLKEHASSVDSDTAADSKDEYSDRSESGFSFLEALNPKEDLSDIMRDLGLLIDD